MELYQDWTTFKATVSTRNLAMQYYADGGNYKIWAVDGPVIYRCDIYIKSPTPASSDQEDFEDNFESTANAPVVPVDEYGKAYVRAESRPLDMTTYFTSIGDNTGIGDGKHLIWDFNNTTDDVGSPPSGRKQKHIDFSFIDVVRIKEGTIYWENMPFGSHISLALLVPNNGYYIKNDGSVSQNTTGSPLEIDRFVNHSPMMGDCPMGDELNTEAASSDVPAGTLFRLIIDVPSSVTTSDNAHGSVQLEIYRSRTVVLA